MKLFSNLQEDLRDWFSKTSPHGDWKRINSKGEAIGPCAREPGEPKPKCMSKSMRASLSKKEKSSAVRRKRKEDPNAERQGPPINVNSKVNENMEQLDEKNKPTNPELWSRAIAQAKSKFDVYPSAYANGWASKWYKSKGGGWKTVSEDSETKSNLKTFKQISEIVKSDVKNDLNSLDKMSFVKKHGLSKSDARQKLTTEAKEKTEYDYEGDMARGQLQSIISNAQRVHDMLKDDTNIAEWVQSKITLAEDYISTVANYMMSELDEAKEVGDIPSGDVNSPNISLKKGKTVITNTVTEASSAAVRMAKALQRAKEQREREERAGAALLKPKPKNEEVMVEREDDEYHTPSKHHVQVQVSKGDGPKTHRKATVRAKEPERAVSAAIAHYKQQGYTVHDHKYLGEDVEQIDENGLDEVASYKTLQQRYSNVEKKYGDESKKDYPSVKGRSVMKKIARTAYKQHGMFLQKNEETIQEGRPFRPMDEPNYKNSIQARQAAADKSSTALSGLVAKKNLKQAEGKNKSQEFINKMTSKVNAGKRLGEAQDDPPFDKPYTTGPSTVTDKSGAKHGPMSRVRDLARAAAKKQANKMPAKKGLEESRQAEIVREAMKVAKEKKKSNSEDKFIADPELNSKVIKTATQM